MKNKLFGFVRVGARVPVPQTRGMLKQDPTLIPGFGLRTDEGESLNYPTSTTAAIVVSRRCFISLQLSILHPSSRRVCAGGWLFLGDWFH